MTNRHDLIPKPRASNQFQMQETARQPWVRDGYIGLGLKRMITKISLGDTNLGVGGVISCWNPRNRLNTTHTGCQLIRILHLSGMKCSVRAACDCRDAICTSRLSSQCRLKTGVLPYLNPNPHSIHGLPEPPGPGSQPGIFRGASGL